jgi:hypothetical protein
MSTFYLLPPRPLFGQYLADCLQRLFPGLDWNLARQGELTAFLNDLVQAREAVYVVHREDLPQEEPVVVALANVYGAEPGDEVVEIRPSGRPGEWLTRRWHMAEQPEISSGQV